MKKNLILTSIIISTIVLAVLSIVTAIRIRNLGTRPIVPSVPESRPRASGEFPDDSGVCKVTFSVPEAPTLTPMPTATLTPTATRGPSPTPTATGVPCTVTLQGRVYLDQSDEAPYRVSDRETFGPVSFRIDYKAPGAAGLTRGRDTKTANDSCGNLGGWSLSALPKGAGYGLQIFLESSSWVVTEVYQATGNACKYNKLSDVSWSPQQDGRIAYITGLNLDTCATKNIWFGVRRLTTPTPTTTGVPPTATPIPASTSTPTPTSTSTPTPTGVPPTSVPGPGPYCDYLQADPTSGRVALAVRFRGKGFDPSRVKGFRFTFGDGETEQVLGSYASSHVQEVNHTYNRAGVYRAILEIMDDGDHWLTRPECEVTITVSALAQAPTSTPRLIAVEPTEIRLPEAGIKIPTLTGIVLGFLFISLGAALVF